MVDRTLNDIAYEFMELYRGTLTDTDTLDIRQVRSWIQEYRAFLLKQKMNRPLQVFDNSYYQTLGLKDLEIVDSSLAGATGLSMLKTVEKIPQLIENGKGNYAVLRISLPDLNEFSLPLYSHEQALASGHGRFNWDKLFPFLLDDFMYVKANRTSTELSLVHSLHIVGVFQSPLEAGYLEDQRYPVAESMLKDIFSLIKSEKLQYVHNPITEPKADDKDTITEPGR